MGALTSTPSAFCLLLAGGVGPGRRFVLDDTVLDAVVEADGEFKRDLRIAVACRSPSLRRPQQNALEPGLFLRLTSAQSHMARWRRLPFTSRRCMSWRVWEAQLQAQRRAEAESAGGADDEGNADE